MFFSSWPKTYCVDPTAPLVALQFNFSKTLLAAVSQQRVYIWSGHQHRVLLGHHILDPGTVERCGANTYASWSSDSAVIAVATEGGHVHLLQVSSEAHEHIHDDTLRAVNRIRLTWVNTVQVVSPPHRLTALCTDRQYLCAATSSGDIIRLTFTGTTLDTLSLQSVLGNTVMQQDKEGQTPDLDGNMEVSCVEYCRRLQLFACAVGRRYVVCFIHPQDGHRRKGWHMSTPLVISAPGATHVAVNSTFLRVAVGFADGSVVLYTISSQSIVQRDGSKDIRVGVPALLTEGRPTGAVVCLQWCPRRRSLAVGYELRGLALFSPLGSLTSSSLLAEDASTESDVIGEGIVALAFGSEGFHLHYITRDSPATLQQLSLVKPVLNTHTMSSAHRIFLVAVDAILMGKPSPGTQNNVAFHPIHVPAEYMAEFWPIKHVAISSDATGIAVAGRRGALVYNTATHKWSGFAMMSHYRLIHCSALTWYGNVIIMVNYDTYNQTFEFLAYHRTRLDLNVPLLKQATHCRPLLIDCNNHHFLAYFTDGSFKYYKVSHSENPGNQEVSEIQLTLLYNINASLQGTHPISLTLMPPLPSHLSGRSRSSSVSSAHTPPVISATVLHAGGVATALDLTTAREVIVCGAAEALWAGPANTAPSITSTSIGDALVWCAGPQGLSLYQVSPNHVLPPSLEENSDRDEVPPPPFLLRRINLRSRLPDDARIYPISFLSEQGVLLGLHQSAEHVPGTPKMRFTLSTKTLSILHLVLAHYLRYNAAGAQACIEATQMDPFMLRHSLDLLVHIGLENRKDNNELRRAVAFARKQPDFHEVIISCARKNEFTYWSELFAIAGSPQTLFQECCSLHLYETASRYLIVIQHFEGQAVGQRCALQVLQGALQDQLYLLCSELITFLRRGSKAPTDEFLTSATDVRDRDLSTRINDLINQELLRLLQLNRLRNVIQLHLALSISLVDRLRDLYQQGHARPTSLKHAFEAVHQQFNLALPSNIVSHEPSSPTNTLSKSHLRQLPTRLKEHLEMAMYVTMESGCVEWATVLATVLLKVTLVTDLLQTQPDLMPQLQALFSAPPWLAYRFVISPTTWQRPPDPATAPETPAAGDSKGRNAIKS